MLKGLAEGANVLDAPGFPKIEISTYKAANKLELVLCTMESPLYAVYVTVPTFVKDNKGLPHTLEHLIFCGSQDYPERGYLDRLATLCQSHGTNAYTTDDHTCYTFVTSSLDGLLRLLPVFLDHIFRPTLEEMVVKREVFHRDGAGTGRGVVYCEMGGREWSEQDQMDLALRRGVFGRCSEAPELRVYGWECGGNTKCLARLDSEEIRQYHRAFYRPDNVVVVVAGGRDLVREAGKLYEIIDSTRFLDHDPSSFAIACDSLDFEVAPSVALRFPANDESLGSVGFGWMGPSSEDMYTTTALHVLMRMLKDTSASPLYQHFVERADPIASDIEYEVKATHHTLLSLIFSGVATGREGKEADGSESAGYLQPGRLLSELKECLLEWRKDVAAVQERRDVSLKSLTLKLEESLEDEPHDICAAYCAAEIVRARWPFSRTKTSTPLQYGASLIQLPAILERLKREPLDFWIGLMDQYLLAAEPAEVLMHPSREMNLEIKQREEAQLDGISCADLPEDCHDDSRQTPLFAQTLPSIPPVAIGRTCTEGILVQKVRVGGTSVKRLTVLIDLSALPQEYWSCLVLLQELYFQADLVIGSEDTNSSFPTAGIIPYQQLLVDLSSRYSTYEAAIGFDNEMFTTGYLDSHLVFSLYGRCESTCEEMIETVRTVMKCTQITAERLGEVLENLISQLKDSWSESSTVLDSRLIDLLYQIHGKQADPSTKRSRHECNSPPWIEKYIGLAEQTAFLSRSSELLETNADELIALLCRAKQMVCQCPMLVNYGCSEDESAPSEDSLPSFWDRPYHLPKNGPLDDLAISDPQGLELIPMSDLTASYLTASVPLNVLPRHEHLSKCPDAQVDRMLSLATLCQLFSYTEGPLYRRIRGAGLAYGASVSLSLWHGLFSFNLNDSTDPAMALQLFTSLVHDLVEEAKSILGHSPSRECVTLTVENMNTAKAAQLFQFVSERSTPASLVAMSIRTALRGLPPVGSAMESAWNARLLELSLKDLAACVLDVVPRLIDPTKVIRLLAVPSSKLSAIQAELEALGYKTYVNNYVERSVDMLK